MAEASFAIPTLPGFIHPAGHIVPTDTGSGAVSPVTTVNSIAGFSSFSFNFFNGGGTGNLLPGRPTTQQATFQSPAGTGALVVLRSFMGEFVTNGGANLTERPLGEFEVAVGFANATTLSCTIRLTDSNSDDPIKVSVQGFILFYR